MAVPFKPPGYHTVTPYLVIKGAAAALEYYKKAFGAEEILCMRGPGDKIMHAEVRIGDSPIMFSDEHPAMGFKGPLTLGGSPVSLMLYVEDVDAVFARALAAGGKEVRPVADQFYGDRSGLLTDPFGHVWNIATHKEDLSEEEINKRAAAFMGKGGECG